MLVTLASRNLVPPRSASTPDGFGRLDVPLRRGLPHSIPLTSELRLLLIVPSGVARTWREADPTLVASSAAPELAAAPAVDSAHADIGALDRPPVRLLLQRNNTTIASVPLAVGVARRLPDGDGARGVAVELVVLDWLLHAGTLLGPGDYGSRVSLAWRAADRAVSAFSEPPVSTIVLSRLKPKDRMISLVGLERFTINRRFEIRRFTAR